MTQARRALNYSASAFPAILATAPNATGNVQVTSLPGSWPLPPFKALLDWGNAPQEAVIVTGQSGSGPITLTCERGVDNTAPASHGLPGQLLHGYSAEEFGQAAALSNGVFNVTDPQYGGQGDGTTDDTASIAAACADLSDNGGGCLYFPCTGRDYITSDSVSLASYGDGILVRGDGYGSRIKATGNYDTFLVGAGNGVAFEYLYFDSTTGSNHTDLACSTTSGSPVVGDAAIGAIDQGKAVSGPGIPGGTAILSVNTSLSQFTMSANATTTASGVALTIIGSTAGAAINFQTGGTVRLNNVWIYNSFNGIECYNGGGRTEIVNSWIYGRNYGVYTQNPLHVLSTGISGDSIGVVADSVNGSLWMMGCDVNGISSIVTRNTLGIAEPNYGIGLFNVGANYNGGGVFPPEGTIGFDFSCCYGELRLYYSYASGSGLRIGGRTDAGCVTTSGSPSVGDASILATDLGKNVSGPGIPSGTVIQTVSPGTGFTMCQAVPASGSHALATQTAVNATAGATVSLLIGPATQDVEVVGGDYGGDNSSPVHGIEQGIHIQAGTKMRLSGFQIQGAGNSSYDGILLDAPVTGPLSITNGQWTRPTLNCINAAALTDGPFNFSLNQFNGEFAGGGAGAAYNATYASQFTMLGNDAGPNIVNGSAIGGSQYDGQVNAYTGPLSADLTGITSSSLASVTALGAAVTSGDTYEIEFSIYYQVSSATGPNVGWGLSSLSASYGTLEMEAARSTTTEQWNAGTLSATGSFTQSTATTTFAMRLKVVAQFSASGTVYPQLSAASGGGTLTVKAGSYAVARRIS